MTATVAAVIRPHTLVRREGARTGAFHAAVWEGFLDTQDPTPLLTQAVQHAWHTACGEWLEDGPRGVMHAYPLEEAVVLLEAPTTALCARCARVGESTLQQ